MSGKEFQRELQSAQVECDRLREENNRLRKLLSEHGIPIPAIQTQGPTLVQSVETAIDAVSHTSDSKAKIALFRSLFRGREDVYAVRWENADGRTGYMPKADRDWKAYYASRPEDRKKVDRKTRTFHPLTDEVVRQHLAGELTVGAYPLLPDETCWFLAVDFDKKTWQEDAAAFLGTCQELDVPATLERSRSGNGGHVWIFFDRAIPAVTARKLGCAILTRTMERRHQVGLDSYDRFFPNQDTMPKGGFGNLIALPLQKMPRQSGNSVFIDSFCRPYADQWQFLTMIQRMSAHAAEAIVVQAQRAGDLIGVRISISEDDNDQDPWALPPSRKRLERPIKEPLPERVQLVRANLLYVEKKDLPSAMQNRLLRLAAFQNPEFYKAQAMRLSTFDKPRVIACGEDLANHIALPRGCFSDLLALLEVHRITALIQDERFAGTPINVDFHGSFDLFKRKLLQTSVSTMKESCALRRPSERRLLLHGLSPHAK